MKKILTPLGLGAGLLLLGIALACSWRTASASGGQNLPPQDVYPLPRVIDDSFQVDVLINGRPVTEYAARGRRYIEALDGAEYQVRIHNPLPTRVAVALSVDGLNTIDARHTGAWDAHKWVIEPYGTIEVGGWQMSSSQARRFYFTTERDSYAAKLGQTQNLGVISAVFFRERAPIVVRPVTPGPPRPRYEDKDRVRIPEAGASEDSQTAKEARRSAPPANSAGAYPPPDDESAATGIGRSVRNDVHWITMDLDSRPASEVTIRYEYRASLVKLGIIPRDYPRAEVIDRRERARGFEPGYCPNP
jgi:hypothetical protein